MTTWMAYAALVGGIVAVGGLAMEKLAAALGQPRRIAWLAALTLAIAIPLTGGWGNRAAVPVVESETPESTVIGGASIEGFRSAMPTLPVPDGKSTGKIALLAWGAGSLASLAVVAGVLVLVARGRRRWERRRMYGTNVYISRRFGPALVGVARPRVVVPAWVMALEPGARNAIIRHETEHARARDHLVLLYGGLAAAAIPWSPAIWWMYRRLRAAVELDCDQRVLASGIGVADYGAVLLNAGSRCRGRWGFSPAMGQPESLLERRLKTMSRKRRKLSGGYGALLAAVAVGAVVLACDTPVPTEVREAFEEVMADDAARGADGEREDMVHRFLQVARESSGSRALPLLFVDGVLIRHAEDIPATVGDPSGFPLTVAEDIVRVEVLKGPAAAKMYGEEGAGGVIQIFTKDAEAESDATLEVVVMQPGEDVTVAGVAGLAVETGPDGDIVTPAAREIAVTEPEFELVDAARGRAIMVRRAARREREGEVTVMPSVKQLVVTGQARDRDLVTTASPGERPVIYIDGVRLDGGFAGLNKLYPALAPERIDRIEVIKGEAARARYGEEGANGVIRIFTKKVPSDEPPTPRRG